MACIVSLPDNTPWQIDMIHILKGSRYDGYFERVAERIATVLTPETRNTILQLKYETPTPKRSWGSNITKLLSKTESVLMLTS